MRHELHKLSHWQFVCQDDGPEAWTWRRGGPDGALEASSEPLQNYGKAVLDAIQHGFAPKTDSWTVHLSRDSLHHPPRLHQRIEEHLERPIRLPTIERPEPEHRHPPRP